MAQSVGQIGLDLVVNQNAFQQQMSGIQNMAVKTGKILAGAFAVKKIVDFGAKALELGSNLSEVQNVVDVTFPTMTKQVDEFAQKAAASFGLSETMAKKYTGTFGSMAKAFGFNEKAAYEMSSALTGLTGDVASFYNIDQELAYTKLKSVFSGETETLKDLGIVMTQSALDAYAMSNGFGKTTDAMSEAEKVALRFQFVSSKLSLAQGDFARTSDGWANQTRLLKLQFESFMASVGQGFINIFSPVIHMLNNLLSKLMTVGNAFKSFTELITGQKSSGGSGVGSEVVPGVQDASTGLDNAAVSADNLGKATEDVGKKAKKSAKEMQALFGFDQINKLSDPTSDDDDDDSGKKPQGGAAGNNPQGAQVDMGKAAEGASVLDKFAEGILKRFKELADLFAKGFKASFKAEGLDRIKEALGRIWDTIQEIFTDKEVGEAFNRMLDKIAYALGQFIGSIATIAVGIGVFIAESIANGLERQKERIKRALTTLFDNVGNVAKSAGNIAQTLSETIYNVLTSSGAIRIGSAIASTLLSAGSTVVEIGSKLAGDLMQGLEKIIAENAPNLTTTFNNMLTAIAPVFETIERFVNDLGDAFSRVYDNHIAPFIESFASGVSKIVGALVDGWDKHVNPVLSDLSKKFKEVYEEHIKPAMDSTEEALGGVIDVLKLLWEKVVQPFAEFLAGAFMQTLGVVIGILGNVLLEILKKLADIWKVVMDGVTKFSKWCLENKETVEKIAGAIGAVVLAWEGIKFASWIEQMGGLTGGLGKAKGAFDSVKDAIKLATVEKVKDKLETAELTAMYAKDLVVNTGQVIAEKGREAAAWAVTTKEKIADKAASTVGYVKEMIGPIVALVAQKGIETAAWIANTAAQTASAIAMGVTTAATWALNGAIAVLTSPITLVIAAIAALVAIGVLIYQNWETISAKATEIWGAIKDWIGSVCEGIGNFFSGLWNGIVEVFGAVGNWFKDRFQEAWNGIVAIFTGLGKWFGERWQDICKIFSVVGTWFSDRFKEAWNGIVGIFTGLGKWFGDRWKDICNIFAGVGTWFGDKFKEGWNGLTNIFSGLGRWFGDRWRDVTNIFSGIGGWFGNKFREAWNGLTNAFSGIGRFFSGIWNTIRDKFGSVGTMVGDAIGGAFKGIINSVLRIVENTINGGIGLINGAIDLINHIPGVNIDYLKYVDLPRLAQGGFVKANTPQLAMIGDNKHYGEIVAPENKMLDMAKKAAELSNNGGSSAEVVVLLKALLQAVRSIDLTMDGDSVTSKIVDRVNDLTKINGESPLIF